MKTNNILPWALVISGIAAGVYVVTAYSIDVKVKPKQSEVDREIENARRQVARTQGQIEARLAALKSKAGETYGNLQQEALAVDDDYVIEHGPLGRKK